MKMLKNEVIERFTISGWPVEIRLEGYTEEYKRSLVSYIREENIEEFYKDYYSATILIPADHKEAEKSVDQLQHLDVFGGIKSSKPRNAEWWELGFDFDQPGARTDTHDLTFMEAELLRLRIQLELGEIFPGNHVIENIDRKGGYND